MDNRKSCYVIPQLIQLINREAIQIEHEKGILIGEEKGEMKAKIAVAKNSLKAVVSIDVIAEITGLSLDEIKQLQEEIV
ncbi:RpnC/YadD family protein [Wolbachia endosymbiont (group A) of Sicus ferrugineus]|uniref:hypothetical protein n=1 Tax=Wolbachia endosymbiont (group A) of Sicus ferrugineus TaxID=2954056 RepID=UPI0022300FEF|nr:hypothetical protein [Wolbachia endosymbiont (group A) of Sicus ferrugineus]